MCFIFKDLLIEYRLQQKLFCPEEKENAKANICQGNKPVIVITCIPESTADHNFCLNNLLYIKFWQKRSDCNVSHPFKDLFS